MFEIDKTKGGKFYFRLKRENGQVIAKGNSYASISGVRNAISQVRKFAPNGKITEVYK